MSIDFFVHPEFPETNGNPDPAVYAAYLDDLIKKAKYAECPVLLFGLETPLFNRIIPLKNRFPTAENSGLILSHSWEKFKSFIGKHSDEELRIHGAYFGQCVQQFAMQLLLVNKYSVHWFDKGDEHDVFIYSNTINGRVASGNIRLGSVYHPPSKIGIKHPSKFLSLFDKERKHGDLTYQLMDDETRVYGANS